MYVECHPSTWTSLQLEAKAITSFINTIRRVKCAVIEDGDNTHFSTDRKTIFSIEPTSANFRGPPFEIIENRIQEK